MIETDRSWPNKIIASGVSSVLTLALGLFSASSAWAFSPSEPAMDGEQLYGRYCAQCHEGQVKRAPHREVMSKLPAEMVLHSLEVGKMRVQGWIRTSGEKRAMSEWITGKKLPPPSDEEATVAGFCEDAPGTFSIADGAPQWNGWGADGFNSRYQSAEQAGISADQVSELKVKWVFGLPPDFRASQPTVTGGRVFIGSTKGWVYSLDAKTGCLYWSARTSGGVRATMVVDSLPGTNPPRSVVYVGDTEAHVYALDAGTGKQLWQVDVDTHPLATITGTPKTHGNRIYVSTTALEEVAGSDPQYECCTFRGKLMALNRFNGKLVWTGYTLPEPPAPIRKNAIGTQLWGPSGASIWSSPALDPERNRIYAATGDNYSDPASLTSDAVVAFDMRTGKLLWSKQFTAGDAWNVGCEMDEDINCPRGARAGPGLCVVADPAHFAHWAGGSFWPGKSRV